MQRLLLWVVITTAVWFSTGPAAFAAEPSLSPILTKDVVGLVYWNGGDGWEAYKKTASYRAFYESGLVPALTRHLEQLPWKQYLAVTQVESGIEFGPQNLELALSEVWQHGMTAAIGIQDRDIPAPYGLIILHGGAGQYAQVQQLAITHLASNSKELELAGRKLLRMVDDQNTIEVHCWCEGNDLALFVTAGGETRQARIESLLTAAPAEQLAQQAQWTDTWGDEPVPTDNIRIWGNVAHLVKMVPKFPEVQAAQAELAGHAKLIEWSGVDQWQTVAYRTGCHGDHLVSEWSLQSNNAPMEWAGWSDSSVSLAELPPLPQEVTSFSLQVIDAARVNRILTEWGHEIISNPEQIVQLLAQLGISGATVNTTQTIDAETQRHIENGMEALGSVICVYQDRQQQVLPWGFPTVAVQVKDKGALVTELDILKTSGWKRDDRWGCPTYYKDSTPISAPDGSNISLNAAIGSMTMAVCDGWLVIGVQPQMVQTFVLRSQGKLPRWSPEQLPAATREKLPAKFSRMTYSDPRATVAILGSMAPWTGDGLRTMVSGMNIALSLQDSAIEQAADSDPETDAPNAVVVPAVGVGPQPSPLDIPPVEVINAPLFPNVSVTTLERNKIRERTYGSTFIDRPVFWFVGGYLLATVGLNIL